MAAGTVEERLTAVETELERLKQTLLPEPIVMKIPWWEQRFGAFADSKEYEEAERLGREYRESLRPMGAEGEEIL